MNKLGIQVRERERVRERKREKEESWRRLPGGKSRPREKENLNSQNCNSLSVKQAFGDLGLLNPLMMG